MRDIARDNQSIAEDGNVITGIGMFFRELAEAVLRRFGYDIGSCFMRDTPDEYTEEDLTFYWSDNDYQEFWEELNYEALLKQMQTTVDMEQRLRNCS